MCTVPASLFNMHAAFIAIALSIPHISGCLSFTNCSPRVHTVQSQVLLTAIEGYSIFCFFALLVTNLGGPNETIRKLSVAESDYCCHRYCRKGCCPADPTTFYRRTRISIKSIVLGRTLLVAIAAALSASASANTPACRAASLLLSISSAGILAFAMSSLVNLCM